MTGTFVFDIFKQAEATLLRMFGEARLGSVNLETLDRDSDAIRWALEGGGLAQWLELVRDQDPRPDARSSDGCDHAMAQVLCRREEPHPLLTTARHCLLVAGLATHFGGYLELSSSDRVRLIRAALVHDLGKALIPITILNKPGPLDPDELRVMRTHASLGHELLVASGVRDPATLRVAKHHHELLDGSGYPDGLSGRRVTETIRVLSICDIYAALTEHRPYRAAMSQTNALLILKGMAPPKLDRSLVDAFARSLGEPADARAPSAAPRDPERPNQPRL